MRVDVRFSSLALKDPATFARVVRALTEAAALANVAHIQTQGAPRLYSSGVRYELEPVGLPDNLLDISEMLRLGYGDCFSLAAWRVAELRVDGQRAGVAVRWYPPRPERPNPLYHVKVRRQDGQEEDPSKLLGM